MSFVKKMHENDKKLTQNITQKVVYQLVQVEKVHVLFKLKFLNLSPTFY